MEINSQIRRGKSVRAKLHLERTAFHFDISVMNYCFIVIYCNTTVDVFDLHLGLNDLQTSPTILWISTKLTNFDGI